MKMKLLLLVCALGLLATGCVSTYNYTAYVGEQQAWKTSPGCFVDTSGALPIYYGYPSKPYDVIGLMICNANSTGMAARNAKYHGGEALVLWNTKTVDGGSVNIGGHSSTYSTGSMAYGNYYGSSQTYSSPSYSVPIVNTFETLAVIKFKSASNARLDYINTVLDDATNYPNGFDMTNQDGSVDHFTSQQISKTCEMLKEERDRILSTNIVNQAK
jgi:hypothetical protein